MLRSGWLTMGPRTAEFEDGVRGASRRAARRRGVELHRGAAPRLPRGGRRPGRRGDRAGVHVRGDRRGGDLLRRDAGVRRHPRPARPVARPGGRRAPDHAAHEGRRVGALRRLPGAGRRAAGAVRRARHRADRGRRARARRARRRAQARHLGPGRRVQLLLQQGARGRRGRPARHRRRRGRRAGALAALAGDDVRHLEPPHRRDRHLRRRRASASTTGSTSRARRCCSRA